jgi:hypothetical protein
MPRHPIPAALLARLAVDVSVQGHGFEASPTDPLNLQMLMKDLRAAVDQAGR